MSVFVAPSSCKSLLVSGKPWNHKAVVLPPRLQCGFTFSCQTKPKPLMIMAQVANPSTYSSRISTDVPLYELPGATFDQYLEDKPRVFRAIFPDKQRSQQLSEEEWRINMLPIDFLFQTVKPVIDMRVRCKSQGIEYPPEVPNDITKVVELEIIRWELQGLDDVLKPSNFSLGVKGILYPDRRGPRTRLTGTLQINMSFILPAALSLIPEEVRREVAESVLRRLMENMKSKVNGSLLADYSSFKREKCIR
ncbi:uncharacterized protein LOC113753223 isoform X1 [Coffea eugenioides]|uniref:uncharacterized protein LOC113753223 isoform X1 n=1 Tax=Coffea eugenioides TaxID=49369 RepID=UPI000F60CA15|nr:uncharacterized protein LOC113753223 isoform X1 [Coffea eugenioides]